MTTTRWRTALVVLSLGATAKAQDAGAIGPAPAPLQPVQPAPAPESAPVAPAVPPQPTTPSAAPAASAPASVAPPKVASPPATPSPAALAAPTHAVVHLHANYAGAYLELRLPEEDVWRKACDAPCDRPLLVDGREARVGATGMTTSNVFRVEPGAGTARLRVNGGSATARQIGLIGLITGVPVSLLGMGLFGYGSVRGDDGLQTGGIVTLAVGALSVVASLPLLMVGTTSVRDGKGKLVATTPALGRF
jgi:hypothetical protein